MSNTSVIDDIVIEKHNRTSLLYYLASSTYYELYNEGWSGAIYVKNSMEEVIEIGYGDMQMVAAYQSFDKELAGDIISGDEITKEASKHHDMQSFFSSRLYHLKSMFKSIERDGKYYNSIKPDEYVIIGCNLVNTKKDKVAKLIP